MVYLVCKGMKTVELKWSWNSLRVIFFFCKDKLHPNKAYVDATWITETWPNSRRKNCVILCNRCFQHFFWKNRALASDIIWCPSWYNPWNEDHGHRCTLIKIFLPPKRNPQVDEDNALYVMNSWITRLKLIKPWDSGKRPRLPNVFFYFQWKGSVIISKYSVIPHRNSDFVSRDLRAKWIYSNTKFAKFVEDFALQNRCVLCFPCV